MTTDAQKKAIKKYDEKFDMVRFRVPAGELEEFKNHAEKQGESLTEFMRRSAKDTIKRDNKKAKK